MRLIKFSVYFLLLLLYFFLFKDTYAEDLSQCAKINVTVNLSGQWPGGSLYGSCNGDTGPAGCTGHTNKPITIANGAVTPFDRCSCWGSNEVCLSIPTANVPAGCTAELVGSYCIANRNVATPTLNIVCPTECPDTNGDGTRNYCIQTSSCPSNTVQKGSATNNACGSGKVCCTGSPCPDDAGAGRTNTCEQGTSCPSGTTQSGSQYNSCGPNMVCCTHPAPSNTPTPSATRTPTPSATRTPTATLPPGVTPPTATPVPPTATLPPGVTPPTATPVPPTATRTPTPPPGATATPTATPGPQCNDSCTGSQDCANIPGCTYCNPTTDRCEAQPTATPTTRPPVCGDPCANNRNVCTNIVNCDYCNPTTQTCTARPACNTPCSNPAACTGALDGCTYCNLTTQRCVQEPACNVRCDDKPVDFCQSGTNRNDNCTYCLTDPSNPAQKTCQPNPYNENMCKCDNISYTPIVLGGDPTVITAYGKVEGTDRDYATIPSFRFRFYESANSSTGNLNIIKQETVPATVFETLPLLTRYQSIWTLALDPNLDITKTYRIEAKPNCQQITAYSSQPNDTVVLASSTQPLSLWDQIIEFFKRLFGVKPSTSRLGGTPTPTLTNQQKKSLQLRTLGFAKSEIDVDPLNNCKFIRFSFPKD